MNKICAECKHWEAGEFWGTNFVKATKKYHTIVQCKGWCTAKKNKRKRWNFAPACLTLFEPMKKTSFIYHGQGLPTERDLENINKGIEELLTNMEAMEG